VFLAVLIPIALGMAIGNLDPEMRAFFKPGERLLIPFFAFALGCGMSFGVFFDRAVLAGGLVLGLVTVVSTGGAGILTLKLFKEKSQIAGAAEASTAGNAVGTPMAVTAAATAAAAAGLMPLAEAERYRAIEKIATAQISIATLTTALLCPLLVMLWNNRQRKQAIDGTLETP
jgi:2-keto-3-deoxygluconate permease